MNIEAMIFDFGNVLIGWDPHHLYRYLIPDEAERTHFLSEICNGPWNWLQDAGRSWDEAIAERIALHPDRADHIRAYRDRFAEMLTGPVAEGNAILDRLHEAAFPCYGLTNWSSETYHASRHAMPFLDHMKYTAVSGDLKMAKPEPEIFHHLLGVIGKPADRCAFIDDNEANIAAAKALGIRAVLFKNDGSATAALREMGLPV
ncbi:HAD family hydrolase [Dongia sp.]|uniref:HAD family hydrolase n=1 Tax=Dongia sp. TaxID=1977262 RepID=UPI003752C5A8